MGFPDPISKLHLTYLRRLWIYFALTEGQFITQPMKKTSHYLLWHSIGSCMAMKLQEKFTLKTE